MRLDASLPPFIKAQRDLSKTNVLSMAVVSRSDCDMGVGSRHDLRYEATIARLSSARSLEEEEATCGDDCMILSEKPLRVTFHFCHAFLYWPDIVHDPSGAVSDRDISKLHQLNVYLFGAKRLTEDWYLADFGD